MLVNVSVVMFEQNLNFQRKPIIGRLRYSARMCICYSLTYDFKQTTILPTPFVKFGLFTKFDVVGTSFDVVKVWYKQNYINVYVRETKPVKATFSKLFLRWTPVWETLK